MTQLQDYVHLPPYARLHLGFPLALGLLALLGLPPTAGFIGKWMILSSLWEGLSAYAHYGWLVVFLLILANIAWSIFFYLKPIYHIFVKKQAQPRTPLMILSPSRHILSKSLALVLVILFFFPQKALDLIAYFSF